MKWRSIGIEVLEPTMAMAIEEVILESVSRDGIPVIHFWDWGSKAVTIGSFQVADDEVHLFRCRRAGIPVIRRISGGGTMFHSPGQEIVFSICAPPGMISKDIGASYVQMLEPVVKTLKGLGMNPSVIENNIMLKELKVSGSAQRRMARAILHHGTVLFDVNQYEMFSYIKGDKITPSGKGTCSNYKPVTSISDQLETTYEELYERIRDAVLEGKDHLESYWTEDELQMADELVRTKYSNEDWNLKL